MKKTLPGILFLLVSFLLVPDGSAQTPYLQVYFDPDFSATSANCPDDPVGSYIDTLYVVAHNFDAWLSAIEFKIRYPNAIFWIIDMVDYDRHDLSLGISPTGIAISFPLPLSAHSPVLIMRVLIGWMCDHCSDQNAWSLICFDGYPSSGYLRAVTYPDLNLIYGTSGTASICPLCCDPQRCEDLPPVPVEQKTWGQIKALYR